MSRKKSPIQLERGEEFIKSYNTRQTQVIALTTAGSGLMGSVGVIADKGGWGVVIVLIMTAAMLTLVFTGLSYARYKAHLTNKRLVFVEPKKEPWELKLNDIKSICTGEGSEKKTLFIEVGDGNTAQHKLVVASHMKVAAEIAQVARKCGARLP